MTRCFASMVFFTVIFCIASMSSLSSRGFAHPSKKIKEEGGLEFAFLKEHSLYCCQREGERYSGTKGRAAEWTLKIHKLSFYTDKDSNLQKDASLFVLKDGIGITGPRSFLRWRLTSQRIWGTERTLDDEQSGIFGLTFREMRQLEEEFKKDGFPTDGLKNFNGGNARIQWINGGYWENKKVSHAAQATIPGEDGWPVGSSGIYFDFIPNSNEQSILLFIFFEKDNIIHSDTRDSKLKNSLIEVWFCTNKENPVQEIFPPVKKEIIDTDLNEPFYVFQRAGHYYFATISGKVYIASPIIVDAKKVELLIAKLESEVFATREKATLDLRSIGKPAQPALEAGISKPASAEQKRRMTQLVSELKPLPDRKTRLLWNDAKRPVDKLLFDLHKKKTYAFTKPNKDKQIYFFEITDKPQPQLFTGNAKPDAPASVPASTRLFLEYARFVRKLKDPKEGKK